MAKKRIDGSESRPAAAAAAARQPRKRTTKAAALPTNPSPEAAVAPSVAYTPVENDAPAAQSVAEPVPAVPAGDQAPSVEEIARTAYSYWVARGRQGGSPEDDWSRAERELRNRRALSAEA
jgi:hypothetical protein